MNLKIVLVCCFALAGANLMAQDELFNPMKDALKTGNAKEVAKFFNASVDMNVEGNVDTYSKAQAEFVLRDFFKKHPPTEFNIVHTGASKGGQQYAIGRYVSNGENYNVMLRVKEVDKVNLIHEINFVKE
ncbi:MAG TPA: DUF4783 domain-containing protein [Cyclobacteriaceae bacterium]